MTDRTHIDKYWDEQALKCGADFHASWADRFLIETEIQLVERYIKNDIRVLDVGCGNGFSTVLHSCNRLTEMVGVDYSSEMINVAKNRHTQHNINFQQGDVRCLDFEDSRFDLVYTTRTLINLATWQEQVCAINECLRVCRPGGTVLFLEAFWEPLVTLNAMRLLFGLQPLVEHDFNRYLKKSKVESLFNTTGQSFQNEDYSCIYYVGTRLLRELLVDKEKYISYNNSFNALFADIEKQFSATGCGVQQAYIVKKNDANDHKIPIRII